MATHIPDIQLEPGQGQRWGQQTLPTSPTLPALAVEDFGSPSVLQGLDVEAKCRGNGIHVFSIELFKDSGFASIVQAA